MTITHKVRKNNKEKCANIIIEYILDKNTVFKLDDLYKIFEEEAFTKNKSYFIRCISYIMKKNPKLHVVSIQKFGTYVAPINIPLPEHGHKKAKKEKQMKEKTKVPSIETKNDIVLPTSNELFDDIDDDDYIEERYFCTEDEISYEGKKTEMAIDDKWNKISNKFFHKVKYTDVVEAYEYTVNNITEYVSITSDGSIFHFIQE